MAFEGLEKLEREELEALCQTLAVELDKARVTQETVSCMFAHALLYGLQNPVAIKTEDLREQAESIQRKLYITRNKNGEVVSFHFEATRVQPETKGLQQ